MPQSLSFVIVHIVFSTKDRRPFIHTSLRSEMHAYLATIARNMECPCYRVGGVGDHVHLALRLKSTTQIAELIEKLKTSSSRWMKARTSKLSAFAWQRGYGAFSVSPQYLNELVAYIENQEEHHKTISFQDELRKFLKSYGVEHDEKYLWD